MLHLMGGGGDNMDKRIQDELKTITDIIVNTIPVKRIFLFGSYATGITHDESDLDIYVVMSENTDLREIDAIRLIRKAIRDIKTMPIDIVVSKENKFAQRKEHPTIEQKIFQEGIILYG